MYRPGLILAGSSYAIDMGVKVPRKKRRVVLLSLLYRLNRVLPLTRLQKFKLYLDLEWIFDRLAMEASFTHYAPDDHPHRSFASKFLLRQLEPGMRVLDLGCAKGDMSYALAQHVEQVVGVDHNAGLISLAKEQYQRPNLSFLQGDALEYLRRGGAAHFDVLILSHILEHLDGPEQFLKDFSPHFKWFYIELPDFDKTYLNHYRLDVGSSLLWTDEDHVVEFDREELMDVLGKAGLRIVEAEYRFGLQRLWCTRN